MTMAIKKIKLINITEVSVEVQEKVRCIRNEEQVRKWMYTDHIISKEEHRNWLVKLKNDEANIVFVVMTQKNEILGVVSINALDYLHNRADWAYYLTKDARSGTGAVLEFFFIDHIFNSFGLSKLNCEVIEHNDAVVSLHEKFGFKKEGFREANVFKNNERLGVHYLGLTKEKWNYLRVDLREKYSKLFSQYDVVIL